MEVGDPQLPTAKPSRGTLAPGEGPSGFAYGAITLYGGAFQPTSATGGRPPGLEAQPGARQPHIPTDSSPVGLVWATPLSVAPTQGIPFWFLFLPLLRCFRSGGSRSVPRPPEGVTLRQEVPFGDPGIDGCVRLPRAYRSLPRPSSAPEPSHPPDGLVPTCPRCRLVQVLLGPMRGAHLKEIAPSTREHCSRASLGAASDSHVGRPPRPRLVLEVIQPHLPVRLPCYDFSPLAEGGFDPPYPGNPRQDGPHPPSARMERRAVCARSRDVFTARC